jgi:hypothetical protein
MEVDQDTLIASIHSDLFNSLGLKESVAAWRGWYSMCFTSISETARRLSSGAMNTQIGGAHYLREHGEALP